MSDDNKTSGLGAAVVKEIHDVVTGAVADARAEGREEGREESRQHSGHTPPLLPSEVSEHMRALARDEAERAAKALIAQYQNDCVNHGPICGVWEEIGRMRDSIAAEAKQNAEERGEARGALKAQARQTTIIVAAVGAIGVVAQVFMLIWKAVHGG